MFKDVLNHASLVHWAEMGLVIFFAVFVMTVVWAMTRSKRQVQEWAAIPLAPTGGRDTAAAAERERMTTGGSTHG